MSEILPQIEHIVVVMLENRSFDNMCGWLYRDGPAPTQYLPATSSTKTFDGLHQGVVQSRGERLLSGPTFERVSRFSASERHKYAESRAELLVRYVQRHSTF
jgi:phospholipase C